MDAVLNSTLIDMDKEKNMFSSRKLNPMANRYVIYLSIDLF